ncbi:MAG: SCO family protein, partial [Phycisphaerae bacterium]
ATPVSNLPALGRVPEFNLIERSGQPLSLSDLQGKVWVADFIFTSCGGPCPIMTRRMGELRRTLKREALSGVLTVSISVDPLRDTPKQLTEYATIHKADDEDWLFLTGGEKEIRDLSIDGFKLPVEPEAGTDQITHSTRFVLVDRLGLIRGYYEIVLNEELDLPRAEVIDQPMPAETKRKLLGDIRAVLAEKASQ